MKLTDSLKTLFIETACSLKGAARRRFMARTVQELGPGGPQQAENELGWNRGTLRKGLLELNHGFTCVDNFGARGRKPAEAHLPNLLADLRDLVDSQSQTDPSFKSTRLYTRLSAAEVRRQLIAHKGYQDDTLPTVQTLNTKLNQLGYTVKRVAKRKPKKRFPRPTPSLTRSTR